MLSVTAVGKRHNIKFLAFLSNTGLLNKLWLCWFVPALLQWSLWSLTELFYAKWKYFQDFLSFRDKDISIKCKFVWRKTGLKCIQQHTIWEEGKPLKSMSYVLNQFRLCVLFPQHLCVLHYFSDPFTTSKYININCVVILGGKLKSFELRSVHTEVHMVHMRAEPKNLCSVNLININMKVYLNK